MRTGIFDDLLDFKFDARTAANYISTHNPYYDKNHWLEDRYYFTQDPMITKNAFVKIKTTGETAEEKTMLEKEKEIMNDLHKRMNKLKKGMAVSTEKGRGHIVAFDYNRDKIGVKIEGFRDGQLAWCDPMLVELDYSRMNKNIVELLPAIKNVVFNDPLTVIVWEDGTKTYVKASGEDAFDPEKGMALAIAKKAMENKYNYFETIREWIEKDQKRKANRAKKKEPEVIGKVVEKKVTEEGVTAKVLIDGDLEVLKALGIVEPVDMEEEYFE